jgi:Cu/Ag efflux protein CusF
VLSSADLTDAATLVTDDELAAALESALAGYVETAQLPLLVSDSLAAGANIGLHFDTGTQKTTITAAGGGGGGSVDSVNGQSGIVELDQDDIADGTTAKQYTAAEKTKLAGIAAGAEVNVNADWTAGSGDSQILNKPTLGSAAAAASTDFATAAQGSKADTAVQPAGLTKAAVGLGNVDNTADSAKPVSTAQAAAIALKYTKPGTGIPSTDLTTAVQTSLGKADTALQTAPVTSVAGRTGAITLTAADAGAVPTTRTVNSKALSSDVALTQDDVLDGTTAKQYTATEKTKLAGIAAGAEVNVNADWASGSGDSQILNKPTLGTAAAAATSDFATAAQGAKADSALQSAPVTSVAGKTGAVALAKGDVGLGNVDNTADAAKPVSTAQQTALDGKLATAAFLNGLTGVWIGTQAQYAALGSYTSTVLYAITP